MAKNERWGTASAGPMIVQASNSLKAHEMFGGKTLDGVGSEFDLADEDVQFAFSSLKDGTEVKHLSITHGGTEYIIPFSRGAKANELKSWTSCMSWMFRTGFMSVKDDDGTPLLDENGAVILDESKPYMSIGLPGLNITRRESGLDEPDENERLADSENKTKVVVGEKPLTQKEKVEAAKKAALARKTTG